MTTENSTCPECGTCNTENITYDSRMIVLSKLNEMIDYLWARSLYGRYHVKKKHSDDMRIKYIKAAIYACQSYSNISKEVELDQLMKDIKDIKKQMRENIR